MTNRQLPRGIRNNNPGNLEWGSPWQGLIPRSRAADARFCQFEGPAWGIRAMAITLITYFDKHGIRTVRQAISRWAPPNENATNVYANVVAAAVGVDVNTPINFHDYKVLKPMVEAIIRHENDDPARYGRKVHGNINKWYDDTTIDKGLEMAGITRRSGNTMASAEGVATSAAAAAGGTAAIIEVVQQITPAAQQVQTVSTATEGLPEWLRIVVIVLTVVAAGAAAWALWNKRKQARAVQS